MRKASMMRTLYVGQDGTERADRWCAFLREHVSALRTASVADIGSLDLTDVDVVIIDGEPHAEPQPPAELTDADLPLPTILIGGMGGKVSDAIGLKLGWHFGCLCLDHRAIVDVAAVSHPIFHGPVRLPGMVTQTIPAPENFLEYAVTRFVREEFDVADIHAAAPGDDESSNPGLVSTSAGFLDSPDCEHIMGGINMKAHDYNAVARQARFLQWGFHGDPSALTELGKALFVNCMHYIASYAGAPVEALRVRWSREVLHTTLTFLSHPEVDPAELLSFEFGPAVPDGVGTTTESALEWYAEHRGFLRHEGVGHDGFFTIDADLVALGTANDDPALLETLAARLGEKTADGDRARRLWQRYVRRDPGNAAAERDWLGLHRDRMFFSDWAGYRWIARDDAPTLTVPRTGTAEAGPVYLALTANRVEDDLQLNLHFVLLPGFYIYAPGALDGIATTIEVVSDHVLVTPPVFPEAEKSHLYGKVKVPMTVRGPADTVELAVRVQACDKQSCTPPATSRVHATAGNGTR
jgi:hypothetical protein